MNIKIPIFLILILSVAFTTPHFWNILNSKNDKIEEVSVVPQNHFKNLSIEAKSVYVLDINSGEVLYAKNENQQFPLASVTKIMTALVATGLTPNTGMKIKIVPDTLKPEGDSGFLVGELWRLKDILDFTLVSSSNDGARAVASVAQFVSRSQTDNKNSQEFFIQKMNDVANALGMTQTFFINESGLDESKNVAGAYGSAKDMAILLGNVIVNYPNLLEATTYPDIQIQTSDAIHNAKNTNKNIETFSGIIASKTGFTDLAGGNLVIAFEAGPMHPIIISVLGSSIEGRFEDAKKLLWASLQSLQK